MKISRLVQKRLVCTELEISQQQLIETNTEPAETTICTFISHLFTNNFVSLKLPCPDFLIRQTFQLQFYMHVASLSRLSMQHRTMQIYKYLLYYKALHCVLGLILTSSPAILIRNFFLARFRGVGDIKFQTSTQNNNKINLHISQSMFLI